MNLTVNQQHIVFLSFIFFLLFFLNLHCLYPSSVGTFIFLLIIFFGQNTHHRRWCSSYMSGCGKKKQKKKTRCKKSKQNDMCLEFFNFLNSFFVSELKGSFILFCVALAHGHSFSYREIVRSFVLKSITNFDFSSYNIKHALSSQK